MARKAATVPKINRRPARPIAANDNPVDGLDMRTNQAAASAAAATVNNMPHWAKDRPLLPFT